MAGQAHEIRAARFVVHGRVQGVFFRAATRQQARLLGLAGWVRNLEDGSVEGMAQGPAGALAQMRKWLERGPELARVLKLEWNEVTEQDCSGFEIR